MYSINMTNHGVPLCSGTIWVFKIPQRMEIQGATKRFPKHAENGISGMARLSN